MDGYYRFIKTANRMDGNCIE